MNMEQTIKSKLNDIARPGFDAIKETLKEHVEGEIVLLRRGSTKIFYDCTMKADAISIKRYPDGGTYIDIHPMHYQMVDALFRKEGLQTSLSRWTSGEPRCTIISI